MARRVLILGGSFDPPHAGHERLLAAALRAIRPDRAYLLPAFQSPFKPGHLAPPADRRRMAELLAREARGVVRVDPFELSRGRTTYTYQALRRFRTRHPDAELWFAAGSDAFASLPRWKHADQLRRSLHWAVGRRPGDGALPRGFAVRTLPGRFPDVSSTEIRGLLLAGMDVHARLPPAIAEHIRRRGLYGGYIHADLRRTLRPERYRHTLAVARLALKLARLHGQDPEAAALAGLLHDCGRRFDLADMIRQARRRRVSVPDLDGVARHAPILSHAYLSADLARRSFGVEDARVLSAIRNHTLGEPGMPFLDRLLFVADAASEDRGFPEASRIRRLALRDVDAAFVEAVRTKLRHVLAAGQWLHPRTAALWNWARDLESA